MLHLKFSVLIMKKAYGQKVDIEFHTSVTCISSLLALMNVNQSLYIPICWGSWSSTSVFKTMTKNFESSGNKIVVLYPQMYHSESLNLHHHSDNKQHWILLKIFLYICYECEKKLLIWVFWVFFNLSVWGDKLLQFIFTMIQMPHLRKQESYGHLSW